MTATVVTSRRRQRELLAAWSRWELTAILINPAAVAGVREAGWSGTHHQDPSTDMRIVGTPAGLGFGADDGWHHPVELILWKEIAAIAESVPDDVRCELQEWHERWREHSRAYPQFFASSEAAGCGPIVDGQPKTPRQEAYVRELEAFQSSGVLPAWQVAKADLEAERLSLHRRALAGEPLDLFEMLDAGPEPPALRPLESQTSIRDAAPLVASPTQGVAR